MASVDSKGKTQKKTKARLKKGTARARKKTDTMTLIDLADDSDDDDCVFDFKGESAPPKRGGGGPTKQRVAAISSSAAKSSKQATKSPSSPKKTASPKKKSPKKKGRTKKEALFDTSSMDVVVPTALLSEPVGGECSLLVQIDPQDATLLDFEGQTGAIGRFEVDERSVTLDLKGFQYHGTLHAGPTSLVVSAGKTGQLKVDSITDEFLTMRQTQNIMAKLNAVVKGDMDESYAMAEEDVNRRSKGSNEQAAAPPTKKRRVSGKKKS